MAYENRLLICGGVKPDEGSNPSSSSNLFYGRSICDA